MANPRKTAKVEDVEEEAGVVTRPASAQDNAAEQKQRRYAEAGAKKLEDLKEAADDDDED